MIKKLNGKHYYVELKNEEEAFIMQYLIEDTGIGIDEEFFIDTIEGKLVMYSIAKCGSFRGWKYSAWERAKSRLYRIRKGW